MEEGPLSAPPRQLFVSRPAGIIFDAYGTLFDVYSIQALSEQLFPGHGAALATAWRDKQIDYTRLRTLSHAYADFLKVTEDALRYSCDRLRLALSEEDCKRLLGRYHRLDAYPDARPALERLGADGFPLAILSNGTASMLQSLIVEAGMSKLFAHVLSADQVQEFKTAPAVYQLGVDAFNFPARDLLFVSSNGWDACCATAFGYQTLWINRRGDPGERLGVSPTAEGRSMDALLAYLGLQ